MRVYKKLISNESTKLKYRTRNEVRMILFVNSKYSEPEAGSMILKVMIYLRSVYSTVY